MEWWFLWWVKMLKSGGGKTLEQNYEGQGKKFWYLEQWDHGRNLI